MSSQKSAKNQYSQEFKIQVLEVLENSPKSMAQVAKEFGIAYPTISSWKMAREAKEGKNPQKHTEENKKLKQEVERLKKENDILKKAATFFAKQLD
jgi:transposase